MHHRNLIPHLYLDNHTTAPILQSWCHQPHGKSKDLPVQASLCVSTKAECHKPRCLPGFKNVCECVYVYVCVFVCREGKPTLLWQREMDALHNTLSSCRFSIGCHSICWKFAMCTAVFYPSMYYCHQTVIQQHASFKWC